MTDTHDPPPSAHGAHRCGNCEGADPDTCLFNPGPVTDDASLRRAVYRILNVEGEFVGCPSATTDRIMDVARGLLDQRRDRAEQAERERDEARAALDAVRKLHRPTEGLGYDSDEDDTPGSYGRIAQACTSCGTDDGYGVRWPCPTIRAIGVEPAEEAQR